ncbi:MAG: DNA polymerase Y family protein [Wenzhouxiangella sp.]|jgi:protein ImuB|nr:DNA polymerase Y family protein [Wenzhouxiangella sp.]
MSGPARASLWAGLYCPGLPLSAVWDPQPGIGPVAVHSHQRGQARIFQAGRIALQHGVRAGMSLSQALALLPQLQTRPRNPTMEQRALEQIALAAYGHSHQVVLAPPDTVLLEIAGSQRLRGGLQPLLQQLQETLVAQGFRVRCGTAVVAAAARLLARVNQHADSPESLQRTLDALPIEALGLAPNQEQAMTGCGLHRLGELARMGAPERARRFGAGLNAELDQLYGRQPTPLAGWQPPERYLQRLELPVPSDRSEALLFAGNRALDHLGSWLEVRDRALTALHITLEREDAGNPIALGLSLARPGFDRARLLEMLSLKLDRIRLPAAIAALVLKADTTLEHRPPQADLWDGRNRGDAWPALLDRLRARLGEQALNGIAPQADHRPELAWRWVSPGTTRPCAETRPRPTWLLPEPRPCRRADFRLEDGPERIEAGWWDGQDCRRDYWIARDSRNRRVWIFHEHEPRSGWFLHGLFS